MACGRRPAGLFLCPSAENRVEKALRKAGGESYDHVKYWQSTGKAAGACPHRPEGHPDYPGGRRILEYRHQPDRQSLDRGFAELAQMVVQVLGKLWKHQSGTKFIEIVPADWYYIVQLRYVFSDAYLRGPEKFGPSFMPIFQLRLKGKWCMIKRLCWGYFDGVAEPAFFWRPHEIRI